MYVYGETTECLLLNVLLSYSGAQRMYIIVPRCSEECGSQEGTHKMSITCRCWSEAVHVYMGFCLQPQYSDQTEHFFDGLYNYTVYVVTNGRPTQLFLELSCVKSA